MSNTEHIPGNSVFFIFHVITKDTGRCRHSQPSYTNSNAPNFSKCRKRWTPPDSKDEAMEIRPWKKSLKCLFTLVMQQGRKKHSSLKFPSTLMEVSRGWGAFI